jgi:hypothetical protein
MKKFLVEPQEIWNIPIKAEPRVVEQIQFGGQYSNDSDDSNSLPLTKKTSDWQIEGAWVVVSDQQGNRQRVPGEQVIQQLVRENQDLKTQMTKIQQEHREIMSRLSQLNTRLRQRT